MAYNAGGTASGKIFTQKKLIVSIRKHSAYYLFLLPALVYIIIFSYVPMYGLQIAFKDYRPVLGFEKSPYVGLKHFVSFLNSYNFWQLFGNTIVLSLYTLIAGFPIPIILALLLNEANQSFRRVLQTVFYAPHFISTIVLIGMINTMFSPSMGVINTLREMLGMERYYYMAQPEVFRHMYVWSGIWQNMGWNAVIYLASLSAVSPELHEAAVIDGASRFQRVVHINIPTIVPTIIILLIMSIGKLATVGYEKVYLMQNSLNLDYSEIISTYVYKRGILNTNYSFSTAVGLFNNVINVSLLLAANFISGKIGDTTLF